MDLDTSIDKLAFVGPSYQRKLSRLEIHTIGDLLHHIPRRYLDYRNTTPIFQANNGEVVTIKGEVVSFKNQYTKSAKKIQIAEVADNTGKITIVWFNQPYLTNVIHQGDEISVAGKVGWFGKTKALVSPEFEIKKGNKENVHTGRLLPLYPETSGITSKWIRARMLDAFNKTKNIKDFLPERVLTDYNLAELKTAFKMVHFPENIDETTAGRDRLAFNELLKLQMGSLYRKKAWESNNVYKKISLHSNKVQYLINSLPFKLTSSQEKSVNEILNDMQKNIPMNRLLEGDVGSGKTVVAAIAAYAVYLSGYKTVFMAPTQLLADQHFQTLKNTFKNLDINLKLQTSSKVLADEGEIDIYVGTHALLHQRDDFENVALVVIDEQHRFGVEQRDKLIKKTNSKSNAPHVLTMTATPIPRTVALTAYGDQDLSILDTLPKGRKKITTWIVPPSKRDGAYDWINQQITKDQVQVFVVCPLIEDSDSDLMQEVKSAKSEYNRLKKIFPDKKIGLLHGKLKPTQKDKVINDFKNKKTDILVTTSVIEVGIDIPNATIMLIETADRFGLAQLHQLRGRVGRGNKKSYCLLFSENKSKKSLTRLEALQKTMSGFELAELDLQIRGPGEIFGSRQSGFPELKIAQWNDVDLIKSARKLANDVFENSNKYKEIFEEFQVKAPV